MLTMQKLVGSVMAKNSYRYTEPDPQYRPYKLKLKIVYAEKPPRPYVYEVYDEENGKTIETSTRRFKNPEEAWEVGIRALDQSREKYLKKLIKEESDGQSEE